VSSQETNISFNYVKDGVEHGGLFIWTPYRISRVAPFAKQIGAHSTANGTFRRHSPKLSWAVITLIVMTVAVGKGGRSKTGKCQPRDGKECQ
jgi:hypothetical protein